MSASQIILPARFKGTIVEEAINLLQQLEHREELEAIMRKFRRKYSRVTKMPCTKVAKAFRWLGNRICEVYHVPKPADVIVVSKRVLNCYGNGIIFTSPSIISFLHELRHHILAMRGVAYHNDWEVQKWAIAVFLLGYADQLPKLRLINNYWLVRRR